MKIKKIALASAVCAVFSSQAIAGSEVETLIRMLHANGTVDDAQFQRLMVEINGNTDNAKEQPKEKVVSNDVAIKLDKGGIKLQSTEGEFSAKIGGRIQMDAAWYDEDGSEMGNGSEVRRARFYLQGKMFNDWGYKLQYDFVGTGRGGIRDAFLSYNGFDGVELKAGNFKNPFMLQEQTSSKYISFTERSLMDAFADGRHLGVMVSTKHKYWTLAAGVFGNAVNTASAGKDEGWGVTGRGTYAFINEKTRVIHLGAAASYRGLGDKETARFKQQAETHVSGINIVDTKTINNVDNYLKVGAEFAVIEKSFSFQSEYIRTIVEREAQANVHFEGWYAEAAYFLTGESRQYKKGKFGGISPQHVVGRDGLGAWQIASRYSVIDLNDNTINGGKAESFTLGVNWFPTSTLRFSANYVNVLAIEGGVHDGETPSLVQLRGQWAF